MFSSDSPEHDPVAHGGRVTTNWHGERLPELVRARAGRPRHEALRDHMTEPLRSGFGAPYEEIGHEVYLLDGSGRIDTMWGATVIELKSDLRRELDDVLARLPVYRPIRRARVRAAAGPLGHQLAGGERGSARISPRS
jgi:hypothetical protein